MVPERSAPSDRGIAPAGLADLRVRAAARGRAPGVGAPVPPPGPLVAALAASGAGSLGFRPSLRRARAADADVCRGSRLRLPDIAKYDGAVPESRLQHIALSAFTTV